MGKGSMPTHALYNDLGVVGGAHVRLAVIIPRSACAVRGKVIGLGVRWYM